MENTMKKDNRKVYTEYRESIIKSSVKTVMRRLEDNETVSQFGEVVEKTEGMPDLYTQMALYRQNLLEDIEDIDQWLIKNNK